MSYGHVYARKSVYKYAHVYTLLTSRVIITPDSNNTFILTSGVGVKHIKTDTYLVNSSLFRETAKKLVF